MKIQLIITELSSEESDVLEGVVAKANEQLSKEDVPLTIESHLAGLVTKSVQSYVDTAFSDNLALAGEKLKNAPYELRKSLIQQVESV